jgi:hypothetical protein
MKVLVQNPVNPFSVYVDLDAEDNLHFALISQISCT